MTSPFTPRQHALLQALRDKLARIRDPDPDVLTNEEATWESHSTRFGTLPVIRFKPNALRIKADIMREAGLTDPVSPERQEALERMREQYDVTRAKKEEDHILADNFNKLWQDIALKTKKGYAAIATLNHLFATGNSQVAEPCEILQNIILNEHEPLRSSDPLPDPEPDNENETEGDYLEELREV